jgi:hypothetical protein
MSARLAVIAVAGIAACTTIAPMRGVSDAPEGRPGLATLWGETRSSRVGEVSFERASSVPFAQETIYYDDRTGLAAAARLEIPAGPVAGRYPGLDALVVDERGRALEMTWIAGRHYVEGEEGQRYGLRVRNRTARRIEAVVSVDGLDVIDGRRASLEKGGYVLEPFETLTIDGFRRSFSEVAAFRFGPAAESYAARTGDDRNVGAIGFAFFAERGARSLDYERIDEAGRRNNVRPFADPGFAQPPSL